MPLLSFLRQWWDMLPSWQVRRRHTAGGARAPGFSSPLLLLLLLLALLLLYIEPCRHMLLLLLLMLLMLLLVQLILVMIESLNVLLLAVRRVDDCWVLSTGCLLSHGPVMELLTLLMVMLIVVLLLLILVIYLRLCTLSLVALHPAPSTT